MPFNRRGFLKQTAAAGSLVAAPYIWTSRAAGAQDENSKPTIAAIGVGGSRGAYNQGGAIARRASQFGKLVAVCDVDDRHTSEFNNDFDGRLKMYRDYRELLEKEKPEIVTIGTPDHWHVPISIAAKAITSTLATGSCSKANEAASLSIAASSKGARSTN